MMPQRLSDIAQYIYYRVRNRVTTSQWQRREADGILHNIYPHLNVVFVHIPKTAGTSLHECFSQLERDAEASGRVANPALMELLRQRSNGQLRISKHAKARHYQDLLGAEAWSKVHSFAVVRNPWDFAVSSYHWFLAKGDQFTPHLANTMKVKRMAGFDEFVYSEIFAHTTAGHQGQMQDWYLDEQGQSITTFVARMEHLNHDLQTFLDQLSIPQQELALPHRNPTKRKPYREYYTREMADYVRTCFRPMVDQYGYAF